MEANGFTLYGDLSSGNCQKVRLVAGYLGLTYDWVDMDLANGASRTDAYLSKFPQGQVPAIELADGRTLAQSNAILRFLAQGSALLPVDVWAQAQIDEWLFWEQYSHEPYIAVCRSQMVYEGKPKEGREPWRVKRGEAALDHIDRHLSEREWLAGDRLSIADIALYAYTSVAAEGGFELSGRPNLMAWLARCGTAFER